MESPTPPPPAVEDVIRFLSAHGFARAAAALRDDLLARENPSLPPVRLAPGRPDAGGDGGVITGCRPSSSTSSGSSDDFVSIGSSPSEMLNPYGIWSPSGAKSEDSLSDKDFRTAREYNNSNLFSDSSSYDDQNGGNLTDPYPLKMNSSGCDSEDKFVMSMEAEKRFRKQESFYFDVGDEHEHGADEHCEGCSEIYSCSVPLCGCCGGSEKGNGGQVPKRIRDSNSAIYGRYQILDDHTERLDECGDDGCQLMRVDERPDAAVLQGDSLTAVRRVKEKTSLELGIVEMDFQKLVLSSADDNAPTGCDSMHGKLSNGNLDNGAKVDLVNTMDNDGLLKEGYNIQPFPHRSFEPDADDVFELGEYRQAEGENQDSGAVGVEEDNGIDELQLFTSYEDEYEIFDLRIIHRKNRTGFEENKDLPIVLNSIIAGRYYVTEYLGSAAFSKVVQAHDLHSGMDVCLKIINNDKDFFDQSLDEIKLLKFVNKHDPADEHHVLRLYDYFYHQEHLFIVTELLRANLYEFQKYNTESGGEVYFTLPRIQAIARQCLEALEYLHSLKIIHCDLKPENILIKSYSRCEIKVIDLGSSCFQMDNLSLYVQSRSYRAPEVILGLPYDKRIDIWSLGCVLAELYTGDVLFPNDSVVMMLARMIGILGPIDMEMLAMGQETHKYFTDNYDLYHRNEETDQIEYLIPEKSSLAHHLQTSDSKFVDFLVYLLQINPRRRPTASQALKHQFLSFPY